MKIPPSTRRPSHPCWKRVYWLCQLLGWGAFVAFGLAMVLPQTGIDWAVITGYGLFWAYSIALTHGLRSIIRRRRWLRMPPLRQWLRLAGSAAGLGIIQTLLVVLVTALLTVTSPFEADRSFLGIMWLNASAANFGWVLLYSSIASFRRARAIEDNALALELSSREARLKALEAQISPHFLFNSLNSLRSMILEDPERARDMVTRLANILRHNLLPSHGSESLSRQLEWIEDYLDLERARFEERLTVFIDIDPAAMDWAIPSTLLQTLVENAIKHGISQLTEGGDIRITAQQRGDHLRLRVENSGSLLQPAAHSTGVGLHNARERLHLLHGPGARLTLSNPSPGRVLAEAIIPPANSPE